MKERDKKGFKDKDRADILLVVNMFLTGFDAKKLNTLYVDKKPAISWIDSSVFHALTVFWVS